MGVRPNQRNLNGSQRQRFVAAVKAMKNQGIYDVYVAWHMEAMMAQPMLAHQGPAFLPWHRQYIRMFEQDLGAADLSLGGNGDLTLPYWNWTVDNVTTPTGIKGRIWGNKFMGPNGVGGVSLRVTTGPFATNNPAGNWPLNIIDQGTANFLQRDFATSVPSLPTPQQVTQVRQVTTYDAAPWDASSNLRTFRNMLEGWVALSPTAPPPQMHNRVHVWVGGTMQGGASPNDPIFFLNHCNVDRIWARWQQNKPLSAQYPPDGAIVRSGQRLQGANLLDPMPPWDGRPDPRPGRTGNLPIVRPRDVLDYQAMGYSYESLL